MYSAALTSLRRICRSVCGILLTGTCSGVAIGFIVVAPRAGPNIRALQLLAIGIFLLILAWAAFRLLLLGPIRPKTSPFEPEPPREPPSESAPVPAPLRPRPLRSISAQKPLPDGSANI